MVDMGKVFLLSLLILTSTKSVAQSTDPSPTLHPINPPSMQKPLPPPPPKKLGKCGDKTMVKDYIDAFDLSLVATMIADDHGTMIWANEQGDYFIFQVNDKTSKACLVEYGEDFKQNEQKSRFR